MKPTGIKIPVELVYTDVGGPDMSLSTMLRSWFLKPVTTALDEMRKAMTDQSALLNDIAAKLRDNVVNSVQALLEENKNLRVENAALKEEDVKESEAAANVVSAVNEISDLFTETEGVPDVPPVTDPDPANDNGSSVPQESAPVEDENA